MQLRIVCGPMQAAKAPRIMKSQQPAAVEDQVPVIVRRGRLGSLPVSNRIKMYLARLSTRRTV